MVAHVKAKKAVRVATIERFLIYKYLGIFGFGRVSFRTHLRVDKRLMDGACEETTDFPLPCGDEGASAGVQAGLIEWSGPGAREDDAPSLPGNSNDRRADKFSSTAEHAR